MKQNLHTHTTYCDGKSSVQEMIRSALQKDFDVLGFSGHSFTSFDKSYCMSEEDTSKYAEEVLSAKKFFAEDPKGAAKFFAPDMEYVKPLRIYLGIEEDLYSDELALRRASGIFNPGDAGGIYDYVIGSTHAFRLTWKEIADIRGRAEGFPGPEMNGIRSAEEGMYIYVDYGSEPFRWAAENIYGGDFMAIARDYFRDEGRTVADTDCDIVGHFDLLLKFNEAENFFDEDSGRYKALRDDALERIFSDFRSKGRQPVFEINTGAMARGYRTSPYPSLDSLMIIGEMGGQILINSDCHQAELLDFGFDEAMKTAGKAGFREALFITPEGKAESMKL